MLEQISRRTLVAGITICAAGVLAAGTFGASEARAQGRMVFATQEAGTMYYTLGSGFAKMLTEKMKARVTVQPYGGSSVYLPIINAGEAQLAFSSSLDAGAAYSGVDRKALTKLRAVARIWALRTAFMVRADSGIKTLADLKGKRVTVDFKGQKAMGNVTRAMLFSGGLKLSDVKSVTVPGVGAGSRALIEGNVDAAFIAVGIPLVKRAHSAIPGGVRYVDLTGGKISAEDLGKTAPGVYPVKVNPAKFLPEVKEPVTVTAFDILLLTSADTPEKTVQAVLSNVAANFKDLQKAYPPLRRGSVKGFSSPTNTVPYHKGAVAYFKANGMWTDANEKKEASFK